MGCWRGHIHIVEYLTSSYLPNPWIQDNDGRYCWQLANEWEHHQAAQIVQQYAQTKYPHTAAEHTQQQVSIDITQLHINNKNDTPADNYASAQTVCIAAPTPSPDEQEYQATQFESAQPTIIAVQS